MRQVVRAATVAVVLALAAPMSAAARASVLPSDRAATHAYLQAEYEYEQVVLADQPAAHAALEVMAAHVGSECAGALTNAPQLGFPLGVPPMEAPSPRRTGEEKRLRTQLSVLQLELQTELSSAKSAPARAVELALVSELKPLRWSDRSLNLFVQLEVRSTEEDLRSVPPAVCQDMKAWTASGYETLSAASKAFAGKVEAEIASFFEFSPPHPIEAILRPYEGARETQLAQKLSEVRRDLTNAELPDRAVYKRVEAAVGFVSHESELNALRSKRSSPVKFGSGRTASGDRYALWMERSNGAHLSCKLSVEVRGGGSSNFYGCVSEEIESSVSCREGRLTIGTGVPATVKAVELLLSDGSRIVSSPTRIPARLGGPAGFYYQQVQGPSPIPVALVELGAHGRHLRTVKLERLVGCTKHPFEYLPGGLRVLARGHAPRGPEFAIVGEHFRLFGAAHFALELQAGPEANHIKYRSREGGLIESIGGESGESFPVLVGRLGVERFFAHVESGCHPYEHAIVYGLLNAPRDRVFVRVAGKLNELRHVKIPADMHAGGVLAYGAFASAPEALIVRSPSGRTVQSEDRRSEATSQRETCEGESEGPGPTFGEDEGGFISLFGSSR
jgi:hypothetical protein